MEDRICDLRIEIVRLLKHPAVLQLLVPHVINQVNAKEIKRLYDFSTERANHRLLDLLIRSDEPGKWIAFQQALEEANYPYLVALLNTNTTCFNQQRRVLEIFTPFLERTLNPTEIVDKLFQLDVIDQPDKEVVLAEQLARGPLAATMILLDRIQTHLAPDKWYNGFLEALYQNGTEDLVREIDPDFLQKRQLERGYQNHETDGDDIEKAVVATEAGSTDRMITKNINRFRNVIVELLDIPSIIDLLVPLVLSSDKRSELIQAYEYDQTKAICQLLDYVISTGKGREFVFCLDYADYPHLARLLKSQYSNGHNSYCQKVIQIFSTVIQRQISIPELVPSLSEENVINQRDVELVWSEYRRKGNTAAAVVLLDRIQSRLSPEDWYNRFLHVLMATSHEHVVEIIEPDFQRNPDKFLIKMKQTDPDALDLEFVSQSGNKLDEELAAICDIKQAYFQSKLNAEEQILAEQNYMKQFVDDKCELLRKDVQQKASAFEEDLEQYKAAVLQLKERSHSQTHNEVVENELGILKERYQQFSGNTKTYIKFERELTLHFLTSVGHVSEVRPANCKNDSLKSPLEFPERIQLTLDDIRLNTDDLSHGSTSGEGSAFVQVTGPIFSDDETSLDGDLEGNKEYDVGSDTVELIVSKQLPVLNQLLMKEIIVISRQLLGGICAKTSMLFLI